VFVCTAAPALWLLSVRTGREAAAAARVDFLSWSASTQHHWEADWSGALISAPNYTSGGALCAPRGALIRCTLVVRTEREAHAVCQERHAVRWKPLAKCPSRQFAATAETIKIMGTCISLPNSKPASDKPDGGSRKETDIAALRAANTSSEAQGAPCGEPQAVRQSNTGVVYACATPVDADSSFKLKHELHKPGRSSEGLPLDNLSMQMSGLALPPILTHASGGQAAAHPLITPGHNAHAHCHHHRTHHMPGGCHSEEQQPDLQQHLDRVGHDCPHAWHSRAIFLSVTDDIMATGGSDGNLHRAVRCCGCQDTQMRSSMVQLPETESMPCSPMSELLYEMRLRRARGTGGSVDGLRQSINARAREYTQQKAAELEECFEVKVAQRSLHRIMSRMRPSTAAMMRSYVGTLSQDRGAASRRCSLNERPGKARPAPVRGCTVSSFACSTDVVIL